MNNMNTIIIQPPVMQLNTAYPSGAYLSAFFKELNCNCTWLDLNLELFYEIFSAKGISRLFELSSEKALKKAAEAEKIGDEGTAFNLRRYVAERDLWIQWIDRITAVLRGQGFEEAHRFCFGAHVPRGSRMENFLGNLDHDLTTDDARSLASYALADLADYITAAFDENFSLVRYAESLTVSEATFAQVEKGADSLVLKEFYEPLLKRKVVPEVENQIKESNGKKVLVCISVPFPGVFAAALCTGRLLKDIFGDKIFVSMGGGFVSTELRDSADRALIKYCDCLSYDRGYGSYVKLLELMALNKDEFSTEIRKGIYNMRLFLENSGENKQLTVGSFIKLTDGSQKIIQIIEPAEPNEQSLVREKNLTSSIIPDFSDIDFSRYPRLIDDTNPMHRLWSDGAWIKAYMAHGCYWHKCAFCDVTLDYVKSFCMTDIKKLYEGLLEQCKAKGVYGIHFVDEAMPPAAMIQFAKENIARGSPLTWWGNVRFEKVFTRDVADYLSYGGLIGVSAGLESATGNGLNAIHKGTDLESIVGACCAFKEAGILVHAYMIYGYWFEKPQDLINSMETLRQFYSAGLLDSCFWHKFVLTRHSRVYKEWSEGLHQELKVIKEKDVPVFARNGLHFEGEKASNKYGQSLEYSLNEWMHGRDLNKPVWKWFNFPVPKPDVGHDFIEKLIAKYEKKRDEAFNAKLPENKDKIIWIGGPKITVKTKKDSFVQWNYMGEMMSEKEDAPEKSFRGRGLCVLP